MMDKDDWIYATGILLISAGAGVFHLGAGLACAGLGIVLPYAIAMVRGGKGPPK